VRGIGELCLTSPYKGSVFLAYVGRKLEAAASG
jgi:hypothetical protein